MEPPIPLLLYSVLLLLGMLAMLEIGRRLALRRHRAEPDAAKDNLETLEAAVFALFGLLIAFAFSGAAQRFQEKRMLVAEEANAIGTAYLRVDLLPASAQPQIRDWFREYVDSRLETYRRLPDMKAAGVEMEKSKMLQNEIWNAAVAATRLPDTNPSATLLLVPALNSMIDITTTRALELQNHPPQVIAWLLFALGLLCSLLAGYRMAVRLHRSWLHMVVFPLVTAVVIYVMIDIEYPRFGLIRLERADQVMVEVRQSMK
jgi:hypothetical protein